MPIDDVLSVELASGQAVPTATVGEPYESWSVIHDDGRVEIGIWEVTPGSFRGDKTGVYESMHFVAGAPASPTRTVSSPRSDPAS